MLPLISTKASSYRPKLHRLALWSDSRSTHLMRQDQHHADYVVGQRLRMRLVSRRAGVGHHDAALGDVRPVHEIVDPDRGVGKPAQPLPDAERLPVRYPVQGIRVADLRLQVVRPREYELHVRELSTQLVDELRVIAQNRALQNDLHLPRLPAQHLTPLHLVIVDLHTHAWPIRQRHHAVARLDGAP